MTNKKSILLKIVLTFKNALLYMCIYVCQSHDLLAVKLNAYALETSAVRLTS